jgi:hypothetical protein
MVRTILGAVAGVVIWFAVVLAAGYAIGALAPAVGEALKAHATVATLCERLAISFLGSILSGIAAALVSREAVRAPLAAGVLLLLWFVPYHWSIWPQFPVWYHATFFVSLPLLSLLGGRLAPRSG